MDLAVETAEVKTPSESLLVQNGPEIFSRENIIKVGRIATATVLVVAVPGAGLAALAGGIVYLLRNKRVQSK